MRRGARTGSTTPTLLQVKYVFICFIFIYLLYQIFVYLLYQIFTYVFHQIFIYLFYAGFTSMVWFWRGGIAAQCGRGCYIPCTLIPEAKL